mmetsp:Transcript_18663/g.33744  ORF Transcript_18663/g.33744 Transcript_18663/m.33744 type:complete len:614 (+) Transcript_18663:90-1931(+)
MPSPAIICIEDEIIARIEALPDEVSLAELRIKYENYEIEDFGELCIMPGLVELNASFNPDPYSGTEDATPEPVISASSENSSCVTSISSEVWEGYDCGTRAAISGGVTTVIESPTLRYMNLNTASQVQAKLKSMSDATLYCDIGMLGYLSAENFSEAFDMKEAGVIGFKAFMIPPAPGFPYLKEEDLFVAMETVAETNLTLFLHPEKTSERYLYMSSPFRKTSDEERTVKDKIPSYAFAGAFPEELNPSSSEVSPLSLSSTPQRNDRSIISPADERTLDKLIRRHSDFMEPLVQAEMMTYTNSGSTKFRDNPDFLMSPKTPPVRSMSTSFAEAMPVISLKVPRRRLKRPPPIKCEKDKKANESSDYSVLIANCPTHWELNGVSAVVTSLKKSMEAKVHISNVSSANAIQSLKKARKEHPELNITWETSSIYLYFSASDVSIGDTRFKTNPPIRDNQNKSLLRDLLKLSSIDSISSYHRPIKPSLKFLHKGDFQRAMNGISSVGFSLQTTWEALKQRRETLSKMAKMLCETPAEIAGLSQKGSIKVGKHADLVVWDPYDSIQIGFEEVFYRHPQVSPFLGRTLPGRVHKVFLRGNAIYTPPYFSPLGKVLQCNS